ncbi:addiction module HigA family antidote [Sphingomonas vulcanisoli]|uniref:Addiction module HigA family antidote n=1 Tax=Sphingomonas vulcanisoli TaxID=1658060 RepID=A0ABX0TQC5_9SPHN|nr:HigA family addiction module antitoxin [Sphingomonas vulcanisoli]NIJ07726.1 addiction module HigA family antidote [Sphingomonas vulcanisoli]
MKTPPHPGRFIRSEIVEGHDLTIATAAKALGVTRQALNNLCNGAAAMTPDMALRLEKAFGISMETVLRMQLSYDIAQVRQRADTIDIAPFVAAA